MKQHSAAHSTLAAAGQLPAGTPTALTLAGADGRRLWLGSKTGIYRCADWLHASPHWERLPNAPLGVIALAASPDFDNDQTLAASTQSDIFVSRDGGSSWQPASLPPPHPLILCIVFSPGFADDGLIVAGTMEDGVIVSDDRGTHWTRRNFGLLDAAVYAIAFSPDFSADGTLYAGTESALYESYNRARAWKPLDFDEAAAPVLSLAMDNSGALFAGTESSGLFRSDKRLAAWQRCDLAPGTVNALATTAAGRVIAATHAGVYETDRGRASWRAVVQAPVLSLCAHASGVIASVIEGGLWAQTEADKWRALSTPPIRSVSGCVLSPDSACGETAYVFGLQEGVWSTSDGGATWQSLNDELPAIDVHALAISPDAGTLAAATPDGIVISNNSGATWRIAREGPATRVCFAPDGGALAAVFNGSEVLTGSHDGAAWRDCAIPWPGDSHILALALRNDGTLCAATQQHDAVCIWSGQPGAWREMLRVEAMPNATALFEGAERPARWHASIGHTVFRFEQDSLVAQGAVQRTDAAAATILSLCGATHAGRHVLFANTGGRILRSEAIDDWHIAHDFGSEIALALALGNPSAGSVGACALTLGGGFQRGVLDLT